MNKISIHELSEEDFAYLENNGHLGDRTKNIAELQQFYSIIYDERLRRNVKRKEISRNIQT